METISINWEANSAIGKIVGVLAVLVTLIYLAIQLKQNTTAVATSTYESTMTGFNDINVISFLDAMPINGGNFTSYTREATCHLKNGK